MIMICSRYGYCFHLGFAFICILWVATAAEAMTALRSYHEVCKARELETWTYPLRFFPRATTDNDPGSMSIGAFRVEVFQN